MNIQHKTLENKTTSYPLMEEVHSSLELAKKKEAICEEIKTLQREITAIDKDIQTRIQKIFRPLKTPKSRRGPKPLSTKKRIERLLQKHPEGLKIQDLAKATDKSASHIYNSLRSLKHNGNSQSTPVIPLGHGRWGLQHTQKELQTH